MSLAQEGILGIAPKAVSARCLQIWNPVERDAHGGGIERVVGAGKVHRVFAVRAVECVDGRHQPGTVAVDFVVLFRLRRRGLLVFERVKQIRRVLTCQYQTAQPHAVPYSSRASSAVTPSICAKRPATSSLLRTDGMRLVC